MHRTEIDNERGLILRYWRQRLTASEAVDSIRQTAYAADPQRIYKEIVFFDASFAEVDPPTIRVILDQIDEIGVDRRLVRSHICFVSNEPHNAPLLKFWLELRDYGAVGTAAAAFLDLDEAARWLDIDPHWLGARLGAMAPRGAR
ncbi:MAG: hypothetical protein RIB45_12690 [Marivibrio sp.]|uniref:hypothetical protein n=1 Tax=Marivibrio sp. TaxID=2039719 RepID=UPI0032EB7073